MSRTRMLVRRAAVAVLLSLGVATSMILVVPAPAQADSGHQFLVPEPYMWCHDYAERQLGNALGVDIHYEYIGLSGSKADNTLTCRIIVHSEGDEEAMVPAVMYPLAVPVNFREACQLQYGPEVGLTWLETATALLTTDPADDWLRDSERGWYCVAPADRAYDQSSRVSY